MAVTKLDVSHSASTTIGSRRMDVELQSSHDVDGELWILYEDATVAIIQISEIFAKINSAVFGKTHFVHRGWLKWAFSTFNVAMWGYV